MPAPRILTIDEVLNADDLAETVVDVPEWGGQVKVKALGWADVVTCREEATVAGEVVPERLQLRMLFHGMVDPKLREDQVELLRHKHRRALERVLSTIEEISGLSEPSAEAAAARFPD